MPSSPHRHPLLQSPWIWIPALFMAESIPAAMVTFVALIMFVQFDASYTLATVYTALLALPWALKPLFRQRIRRAGHFKRSIHLLQFFIFLALLATALYVNRDSARSLFIFLHVFLVSELCAWHSVVTHLYYERILYPRQQHLYNKTKHLASQTAVVLTYGILIIFVGFLEVFFRDIHRAWAMENYLLAGVFFLVFVVNLIVLPRLPRHSSAHYRALRAQRRRQHLQSQQPNSSFSHSPILHSSFFILHTLIFFLLLPQSLLFCTRLLYLIAPAEADGLHCSLQDVGFAQGTIGVIAFSAGTLLGNRFLQTRISRLLMPLLLTLSPVFYYLMTIHPQPDSLTAICLMTGLTQFSFGYGLNLMLHFLQHLAGNQYRNTTNFLYVSPVAASMLLPVALSGYILQAIGFQDIFRLAVILAIPALLILFSFSHFLNFSLSTKS